MRVLEMFKFIDEFKIIINGLISSSKLLAESFYIFLFFSFFYTLIGLQLFSGLLKKRCILKSFGIPKKVESDYILCGNIDCPQFYFCSKTLENIDFGNSNFDSFIYSWIQVLRVITFNRWYILMNSIQSTYSDFFTVPYFISLSFIGNYFLVNLILAVLKVKYAESQKNFKSEKKNKYNYFNLKFLKNFNKDNLNSSFDNTKSMRIIESSMYNPKKFKRESITNSLVKKKKPKKYYEIFKVFYLIDKIFGKYYKQNISIELKKKNKFILLIENCKVDIVVKTEENQYNSSEQCVLPTRLKYYLNLIKIIYFY